MSTQQKLIDYSTKMQEAKALLVELKEMAEELDLVFDIDALDPKGEFMGMERAGYDVSDWDDSTCS